MAKKDTQQYPISEAIELVKKSSKTKFDATVEVHINMAIDPTKPEQALRYPMTLPNGTGKEVKVAVFTDQKDTGADLELKESDLDKIMAEKIKPKVDFDILITEPKYMPKIAKIGKTLGPAGVMPNPKSGTVTEDVKKAVASFKKGQIEVRNEPDAPVVHTILGKVSFENKKLVENYHELISSIRQKRPQKIRPENYIKSVFVSSTMGPSYQISL